MFKTFDVLELATKPFSTFKTSLRIGSVGQVCLVQGIKLRFAVAVSSILMQCQEKNVQEDAQRWTTRLNRHIHVQASRWKKTIYIIHQHIFYMQLKMYCPWTAVWFLTGSRTWCDLINSDPELLGRSLLSATLPDRGQQYAVVPWPLVAERGSLFLKVPGREAPMMAPLNTSI